MINVSQAYKDTMVAGLRNFNAVIDITLQDGTQLLNITNANLRTFSLDDAVSDDNQFTMLGSVIINQFVFTLDDMSDDYYYYNFYDAEVVVHLDCHLIDKYPERIRKGTFFVAEYRNLDGVIELTCYDNLAKFDRDYSLSALEYPTTIRNIVMDACDICGVTLADKTLDFADSIIAERPGENSTFREVLSWVGQIIGCYAKCNTYGELEFKWCDIDVLNDSYGSIDGGSFDDATPKYITGDNADGGSFNPWNIGFVIASASFAIQTEAHNLYYNFSQEVAVADTIVTGVSVVVDPPQIALDAQYIMELKLSNGNLTFLRTDTAPATFILDENDNLIVNTQEGYTFSLSDEGEVLCETEQSLEFPREELITKTFSTGTEGFVIQVENNELISEKTGQEIATRLGKKLIGMRFRKATTSHMNDPTIEAGDIAVLWDRKNRAHPIIVTHTNFKLAAQQRTVCGVESGTKNTAVRYSANTKTYARLNSDLHELSNEISSLPAMYGTSVQKTPSSKIYYLHNQVTIEKSSLIWRLLNNEIAVSTDGGKSWTEALTPNILRGTNTTGPQGLVRLPVQLAPYIGTNYTIMLQKYGSGDVWIQSKARTYFEVAGTNNLQFDWEVKW